MSTYRILYMPIIIRLIVIRIVYAIPQIYNTLSIYSIVVLYMQYSTLRLYI